MHYLDEGPRFAPATCTFSELVSEREDTDGAAVSRRAAKFGASEWTGRSMMAGLVVRLAGAVEMDSIAVG